jgi:hypothetical protein
MRRSFLQQSPNILPDPIQVLHQLRIPDAFDLNPIGAQKSVAFRIMNLLFGMSVSATINFENQPRFGAVKIQIISDVKMLPAKFVTRKAPFTQDAPKLSFSPRLFAPKLAGACRRVHAEPLTPALSPSDGERGNFRGPIFLFVALSQSASLMGRSVIINAPRLMPSDCSV